MSYGNETMVLRANLLRTTEKAFRIELLEVADDGEFDSDTPISGRIWLPKSQVRVRPDPDREQTVLVRVPLWLAEKKPELEKVARELWNFAHSFAEHDDDLGMAWWEMQ